MEPALAGEIERSYADEDQEPEGVEHVAHFENVREELFQLCLVYSASEAFGSDE